jgi:hypothetical protein
VVAKTIVSPPDLAKVVRDWIRAHGVTQVVVGNSTGSSAVVNALGDLGGVPVTRVDETGTTLLARSRFFADRPRRGWRRLIPISLQTPPEPYDDYVAILLAERALGARSPNG